MTFSLFPLHGMPSNLGTWFSHQALGRQVCGARGSPLLQPCPFLTGAPRCRQLWPCAHPMAAKSGQGDVRPRGCGRRGRWEAPLGREP